MKTNDANRAMLDSPKKSVRKILAQCAAAVCALIAAYLIIAAVIGKIADKPVYIFGYTFNLVVTDSMEPEIMVGDFVLAKKVDINSLEIGDNIVFQRGKIPIIHSVYEIETDPAGKRVITTKGVNVDRPDVLKVTESNLIGIQVGQPSAFWGKVFTVLKSGFTWVAVAVILVLSWLTAILVKNIRQYKKEAASQKTDDNEKK